MFIVVLVRDWFEVVGEVGLWGWKVENWFLDEWLLVFEVVCEFFCVNILIFVYSRLWLVVNYVEI